MVTMVKNEKTYIKLQEAQKGKSKQTFWNVKSKFLRYGIIDWTLDDFILTIL